MAEAAAKETPTGARALRYIFSEIINPFEFDPWNAEEIEDRPDGGRRLLITADLVREALR